MKGDKIRRRVLDQNTAYHVNVGIFQSSDIKAIDDIALALRQAVKKCQS